MNSCELWYYNDIWKVQEGAADTFHFFINDKHIASFAANKEYSNCKNILRKEMERYFNQINANFKKKDIDKMMRNVINHGEIVDNK